jgi:CRP/FNR family cyclic AMP-dependent transcriptional regulator
MPDKKNWTAAMVRQDGLRLLSEVGWLSTTTVDFRQAVLATCSWQHLEAGEPLQSGGEEEGELIGLASGSLALRTILGPADTPIMHLAHPVFWLGYVPLILGKPRRVGASAKSAAWIARVPEAPVRRLLSERPEWWQYFSRISIIYGDTSQSIAADLLIGDSERRCGAVLLRLSGHRLADRTDVEPVEVALTQTELAGAANLSRNSIGTMLRRLVGRGLVELGYRGLIILNPAEMRAFVDSG